MKRVLFIDRDGTLIVEPAETFQVDTLDKLEFLPAVMRNLYFISKNTDFELVMVSNQDGLGTDSYPAGNFDSVQEKMLLTLKNEGVEFNKIFIDPSLPEDNSPNRKPRTGMLTEYMNGDYDLKNSFVIGDRQTDVELAKNLDCRAILVNDESVLDGELKPFLALATTDWNHIAEFIFAGERCSTVKRTTRETDIFIEINIDGSGKTDISTGLNFLDHLLDQIGRHASINLTVKVKGDLHVDEHHTVEDTAIALGEALYNALGNKRGTERYGFCLPMDDCLCTVALDFGGRSWLVWDVEFRREHIGDVPTEMFPHFFKSLGDAAKMNLHIRAEGNNEHHKIEGIFKAFAKAVKMAVRRDIFKYELPTTKGLL
ncbi:MAG: bifunctional histidinol-phosphatase/imidazoleglycerol-phosphate dehydratase HisB [Dysgonamonadaceae bacterium]|jgi:imidazoleglycerol-phosphate dehydratase/histidinol-phosphatase|nr:bifunctional histidinol-phosphatase/imidazoleglycerol-phosphate dehydratase HisB [Dysgonamonadaceae bacterium]